MRPITRASSPNSTRSFDSMTSHEISPLRYPGGKGGLAPFVGRVIEEQRSRPRTYVEPFAGGAGVAVRLLYDEYVEHIVINDLDAGVAAFWRSVFWRTEDLAQRVETAEVSVAAWRHHHAVYMNREREIDELSLGFATFFLNRTNRSGILDARPIGGLRQTGAWKIDARFNRDNLAWRIRELGRYRNRVTVLEQDGIQLSHKYLDRDSFIYADPPYLLRGSDLYFDNLTWEDHRELARILSASRARWLVTYDFDPRVAVLYPKQRRASFSIAHTAAKPHLGREIAVFGNGVALSSLLGLGRDAAFVH